MGKIEFECGCSVGPEGVDFDNINYGCKATWDLLGTGKTQGVFQIESGLGKQLSKKLKPDSIEEMAALTAIMRPSCLKCISGDTKIIVTMYGDRFITLSLKELYFKFGREHNRYGADILSYNEETNELFNNKILDVQRSKVQEVYRPKFRVRLKHLISSEYKLECSLDHKLLTTEGYKKLSDIKIGERVLLLNSRCVCHNKKWTTAKTFRDICFANYQYKCLFCDWKEGCLDVNHIDGNRKVNNHPDNLCFLCPNHHRLYTEKKISIEEIREKQNLYKLTNSKRVIWGEYLGFDYIGKKQTYDISVQGPYYNYIAGRVIVHNCIIDGKSLTNHYIDRKHNKEPVEYFHKSLEPILNNTHGILVYQEQILHIAKELAGFDLKQADDLRKGTAKKNAQILAELKEKFVQGAITKGIINKEEAEEIYSWIWKSARYSFNASHSVAYSVLGYWTAWIKQHFPLEFYTSWLTMAKEKQDPHKEIAMLVNDARTFNIDILPPSIFNLDKNFHIDGAAVRFGLIDIKKIGDKQVDKIKETFNGVDKGIKWFSILINHLPKINSACAEAMISAGMFDFTKTDRRRMLYEFNIVKQLSDAHIKLLQESNTSNLKEGLEYCINKAKKVSLPKLTSLLNALNTPPYRLVDEIPYLAGLEGEYLGVALTCSRSSGYNYGDTVCLDVINGKIGDMIIVAEITNLSEYKINNKGKMDGRTMCYIALQDDSAELQSCVMFPDNYEKYKTMLYVGGVILLKGNKQKDNNLIIETIKCL
jgi:hypothetical protein